MVLDLPIAKNRTEIAIIFEELAMFLAQKPEFFIYIYIIAHIWEWS
jgi:hypothetical protein